MRTFTRLVSVFLLTAIGNLFFLSCSGREKNVPAVSILEIALQQAGENRVELEKVLSRYHIDPADSLKYRAACFLIENMPYYTYYKGKQLDRYFTYYALLQETRGLGISPQVVADSVCHMYGTLYLDSLQSYRDIETVDSAYLCNNIEWSFKVWQEQPWGKHVSFADFCEYLLPYRIGDETLASWRESIYQKYNPLLDSLRASGVLDKEDPIVAARCLLDSIRGSVEDFENMFGLTDADKVYKSKIEFYCPHFICTHGGKGIRLYTKNIKKHYEADPLQTVSTVGAGDNFNAGVVFGLLKYRIRRDDLDELSEDDWDHVIRCGKDFSADVCMSLNNSISKEFAAGYR